MSWPLKIRKFKLCLIFFSNTNMKFQPSLLTLTLFALFAHTGLAWADKGWVTTYSYDGSSCSGEAVAISSQWGEWDSECVHVAYLYSAYKPMEHTATKFQCTASNEMSVSNYEGYNCKAGSSRIIRSGECHVDNEGGSYKIFFNCYTGSKHDYDSDEPKNFIQVVGEYHDDSTCGGSAERHITDTVYKQDYCYKSGDDEDTWQNSYMMTCDGDKGTHLQYQTSDCSGEAREVETFEDICWPIGLGTGFYIKADITCGEKSIFEQALSWFKEQAENLGLSEEALVGLVAGGSSVGGLSIVLLVYRCCCTGSSKRSTVMPRLRDLV